MSVNRPLENGREGRLRELDGWRAVSVLLVVQQHLVLHQHARILSDHPSLAFVEHNIGALAVKIFFVISGFVICRLLISEELRNGAVSVKAFYYRRAFRILPPLAVYLAFVSLLVSIGFIQEYWRAILGACLFLSDIHLWPWGTFVGHIWSLAVEEQFYLTLPVLFVLTPPGWRARVSAVSLSLFALWNLSMIHTGWDSRVSGEVRAGFICIACGVLMAIHEHRMRLLANRAPAFAVVLIAILLFLHPVVSYTWQGTIYESLLVPPSISLLLLFSLERGPWLRAFLCSRPVQAVGITSYGTYIWQQFFTEPGNLFPTASHVMTMTLPLLFAVVPLSYFLIEKPAMRYGKILSQRAQTELAHANAIG